MAITIKEIKGYEILDSRGRPTVMAKCLTHDGYLGKASVPSGASTGKAEAMELRDGDSKRFGGLGCKKAVAHINDEISRELAGKKIENQESFDQFLLDLDGTPNKSNLGANAILACSLAFARASALAQGVQLYSYFGKLIGSQHFRLPRVTINLFSGGKHAGGQIPLQDLLVVPVSATSISESLRDVYAVYQSAVAWIKKEYGMRALTADEGGLAPDFGSIDELLDGAVYVIQQAGIVPGKDMALAMDVASSHFFSQGKYHISQKEISAKSQIDLIREWVEKYPIVSVEDGLAEDDWESWPDLFRSINKKSLVLGDDLLCTQVSRIQQAIDTQSANALLLKVNQCGSLTEAANAYKLAKSAGWQVTVSARSGETEDDWLADLAVGWSADQIKVGSITQSERLAKYNRLLEIEADWQFPMNDWPNP